MVFSGIIGLGLSVIALIYCALGCSDIQIFLDVPSLILVAVVIISATLMRYSFREVAVAFVTSFSVLLRRNRRPDAVMEEMSAYAIKAEREGPDSLTDFCAGSKDSFTKDGLALVAKGTSPERIEQQMLPRVAAIARQYSNVADLLGFLTMVTFPLAFLWTLVGLVLILQNMDDPNNVVRAIGVALIVSLYGLIMVAMLTLPLSGRVKAYGKSRQLDMLLRLDGFKYLAAGMVHTDVESRLSVRLARLGIDTRLQDFSSDLPMGIIPAAAGGR